MFCRVIVKTKWWKWIWLLPSRNLFSVKLRAESLADWCDWGSWWTVLMVPIFPLYLCSSPHISDSELSFVTYFGQGIVCYFWDWSSRPFACFTFPLVLLLSFWGHAWASPTDSRGGWETHEAELSHSKAALIHQTLTKLRFQLRASKLSCQAQFESLLGPADVWGN